MAPPPGTLRVGRYFLALLTLLALLYLIVFFPGKRHTPKLGIDLVGGLRVVFSAQVPKGSPAPTSNQMTQARQILEDRINTTGVTGSTVVVQGNDQLVVEIPNGTSTDVARLGKAAILNFRGLVAPGQVVTCAGSTVSKGASSSKSPTASPSASGSQSASSTASSSPSATKSSTSNAPNDAAHRPLGQRASSSTAGKPSSSTTPAGTGSASGSPTTSATPTAAAAAPACEADPFAGVVKADPSLRTVLQPNEKQGQAGLNSESCPSPAMPKLGTKTAPCTAWSSLSATQQKEITDALARYKCSAAQTEPDNAARYYIACDPTGTYAYLLGHVVVAGRDISNAQSEAPSVSGNGNTQWTVRLTLGSTGADKWSAWTTKFNTKKYSIADSTQVSPLQCSTSATPCSLWVGFTLDGAAISLPVTNDALSTNTSISGGFDQTSANDLARELNYGKLPVSFHAESIRNVSATLGSSQLHGAFLAGGIGLVLVIIYSLIYYRALGIVTIASLMVSAALTYAMLVILATQIGFTLDLSGIAGFIVALGITADSFVVFFERIKDEVHEGRSLRVAVPRAWVRARRTILSADTVSFLAAAILYYFASADVKGFAFTLGLSTILDLVVVFLFTHPMISLLSRSRAFGSPRFTGLANVRAGGITRAEDDAEARRPSAPRRARGGRPQRPAGGTVVLDEPDAEEQIAAPEPGEDAVEPPEETAGPEEPRRRTTPRAGSAAERAAARRARMREQGKEDS